MTPERYYELQSLIKKSIAMQEKIILNDGIIAEIKIDTKERLIIIADGQSFLVVLSPRI